MPPSDRVPSGVLSVVEYDVGSTTGAAGAGLPDRAIRIRQPGKVIPSQSSAASAAPNQERDAKLPEELSRLRDT